MKNLRFLLAAVLILGFLALFPIPLAHAHNLFTCTWDGTNNNWESAHWIGSGNGCGTFPDDNSNAFIPSGTVTVTGADTFLNLQMNGGNLIIDSGGSLTTQGTINNNGAGSITNMGTFTDSLGGLNNNGGGTITNTGTLALSDHLDNGPGTIINRGTITVTDNIANSGTITNCGGTITFGAFSGNAIVSGGTACGSSTPPIPEYPIGLPILAIFMIIGYGLIRRKTRYD
ncbi:MAG: hypothetical protein ABSF63_03415 [Candidatus Bathyarchaeia archaeon]